MCVWDVAHTELARSLACAWCSTQQVDGHTPSRLAEPCASSYKHLRRCLICLLLCLPRLGFLAVVHFATRHFQLNVNIRSPHETSVPSFND